MATLDDILTTQKNGVIAINNLGQAFSGPAAFLTTQTVSAATVVLKTPGKIIGYSIVQAGSTTGFLHNFNSLTPSPLPDSTKLVALVNTAGYYPVSLAFSTGLVIVPGTGQLINVTYYLG